jgi:hypothetical protein
VSNSQTQKAAPGKLRADKSAVLRSAHVLFAARQVVELRAPHTVTPQWRTPHTVAGYFDDWNCLAEAAVRLHSRGIYWTPNPVNPALLARAANRVVDQGKGDSLTAANDILARRWLLVDLDPVRPANISSTDEELGLALARAVDLRGCLADLGWPAPLYASSGNGAHLMYRIDLPADDDTLVMRTLAALAARFDDDRVRVDQKVFDPNRIWKVYGTVAAKGDNTPERPHRLATVLDAPAHLTGPDPQLVTPDQLAAFAVPKSQPVRSLPAGTGSRVRAPGPAANGTFDLEAWLERYRVPAGEPRPWSSTGGRKWIFAECPRDPAHTDTAFIVQFPDGPIAAGCHHNSCRALDWAAVRGMYEGRPHPPPPSLPPQGSPQVSPEGSAPAGVQQGAAQGDASQGEASPGVASPAPGVPGSLQGSPAAAPEGGAPAGAQAAVGEVLIPLTHTRQYEIDPDNRMVYLQWEKRDGIIVARPKVVADFAVTIVAEATGEDGGHSYTLAGTTVEGKAMRLDVTAEELTNDRELLARLTAAAGPCCPVRAGMASHLRPAIQLLTAQGPEHRRRYDRTGWDVRPSGSPAAAPSRFLIPGRAVPGVSVHLPRKLPYRMDPGTDLGKGLMALEALLHCMDPMRTTVALAFALQAPLARLAGWGDERFALFIVGRTGSLKTSFAQVLMCLYGAGFLRDEMLLKLGEGATRNALGAYAAHVHDLPLLLDNFKPNTGDGDRGFVNMLHNLLEGGERERLTRTAELKDSKPLNVWPLFTGEDVPQGEPSTLARMLILPFRWLDHSGEATGRAAATRDQADPRPPAANELLALAQRHAGHLPAVGAAWIEWLEGDEGREAARKMAQSFPALREQWVRSLLSEGKVVNPLRVATNLATNQLAYALACEHPVLGPVLSQFEEEHLQGLGLIAADWVGRGRESLQATRFLDVLHELLSVGKYVLAPRGKGDAWQGDRMLGWVDADGSVYLVPDLARAAVEQVLGRDGLHRVSNETLANQLDGLGVLAGKDKGRATRTVRIGGGKQRVLHLTAAALGTGGPEPG